MNSPSSPLLTDDPKDPAGYRYWRDDTVRFNDLDPVGHVTSISFLVLFETARILFVRDAGQESGGGKVSWMLVGLNASYHAQLQFPGQVRVGTRIKRLGRTSLTTVQGMFDGDTCVATLETSMVLVDRSVERGTPLPDGLRQNLTRLSDTGA